MFKSNFLEKLQLQIKVSNCVEDNEITLMYFCGILAY